MEINSFSIKEDKIIKYELSDDLKELIENGSVRVRTDGLPEPKIIIQIDFTSITQVLQNLRYIGELRQRWNEIKKLQLKSL